MKKVAGGIVIAGAVAIVYTQSPECSEHACHEGHPHQVTFALTSGTSSGAEITPSSVRSFGIVQNQISEDEYEMAAGEVGSTAIKSAIFRRL
jgi:hypothetical protein